VTKLRNLDAINQDERLIFALFYNITFFQISCRMMNRKNIDLVFRNNFIDDSITAFQKLSNRIVSIFGNRFSNIDLRFQDVCPKLDFNYLKFGIFYSIFRNKFGNVAEVIPGVERPSYLNHFSISLFNSDSEIVSPFSDC